MHIINTATDLQGAPENPEHRAFLQALLDDYTTFDDAEYPEGYDRDLGPDDEGYIEPVIRKEWNAGAAAAWGFASREQIESALVAGGATVLIRARNEDGTYKGDDPATPDVNEAWTDGST